MPQRPHGRRRPLDRAQQLHGRLCPGRLQKRAADLAIESSAPKPIVLGRHLIALGMKPGPGFKPLLDAAFEAQIEGAFSDEAGGLVWVKDHAG